MASAMHINIPGCAKFTLLLVLLFLSWQPSLVSSFKWHTEHTKVVLQNYVSQNTTLYVHCVSSLTYKNHGGHRLAYGQQIKWKFVINFWETTFYWCFMAWEDPDGRWVIGTGDIFKAKHGPRCDNHGKTCYRAATRDGVHNGDKGRKELLFSWKYI